MLSLSAEDAMWGQNFPRMRKRKLISKKWHLLCSEHREKRMLSQLIHQLFLAASFLNQLSTATSTATTTTTFI